MTQAQAIYCALAGYFGWVLSDVSVKLGAQAALPPAFIMGVLGAIGALGTGLFCAARGRLRDLHPASSRTLAVVALSAVGCGYTTVIALKHLPITVFYILVFTSPFVIAALSTLLKHEVMTGKKLACLVTGFLGVVIAVGPVGVTGGDWVGYLAVAASVSCFSVYTLAINRSARRESTASMLFVNMFASAVCGLGVSALAWPTVDARGWGLLAFAGIVNLISCALYNKALKHTSSTNVAQVHYVQIILGAVLGYVLWGEVPTVGLVFGAMLIMLSGLVVARQAHREDCAD